MNGIQQKIALPNLNKEKSMEVFFIVLPAITN